MKICRVNIGPLFSDRLIIQKTCPFSDGRKTGEAGLKKNLAAKREPTTNKFNCCPSQLRCVFQLDENVSFTADRNSLTP